MGELVEVQIEVAMLSSSYSNSSSKVAPLNVLDQQEHLAAPIENNNKPSPSPQQVEAWLPITESRKSNFWTSLFHLISSGIGIQTLVLPFAFIKLGWYWGSISLTVIYVWQLYTTWLLVNLHESSNGTRYSRYLHLSVVAFGDKLAKMFVLFPVLYLASGTCIMFTIIGGATMEQLYKIIICDNNNNVSKCNALTGAEWLLVFISLAIIIALFFPNLNSLARVSLVGSIAAISYIVMIWTFSIGKGRVKGVHSKISYESTSGSARFRDVVSAIGVIAYSFRGHNLMLEIQGTIPTNDEHGSKKIMWRGVIVSYSIIALCIYPIAIVGYWAYGDEIPTSGGILSALTKSHQQSTSKWLLATIYLLVLVHYLSAFQIYAMPILDNWERIYITIKNQPCSKWIRIAIKLLFGGIVYFLAVAVPFLPVLGAFVGGFALPLTFVYPSFMWIAIKIKKTKRSTRSLTMWILNMVLGSSGLVLSALVVVASLWKLVDNGMHANFFKP